MTGSSSSKTPDMAEGFMKTALEKRKTELEDEIFHKVLRFGEELYELESSQYVEGTPSPEQVALMKKYRQSLHIAESLDIFTHEGVYTLMQKKGEEDSEEYSRFR